MFHIIDLRNGVTSIQYYVQIMPGAVIMALNWYTLIIYKWVLRIIVLFVYVNVRIFYGLVDPLCYGLSVLLLESFIIAFVPHAS